MLIHLLLLLQFWFRLTECYHFAHNVSKRVIGGYTAFKGEFPYQVAVLHATDGLICGGSIITKKWVLSAAHCFDRYKHTGPKFRVLVGDMTKTSGQNAEVINVIVHENFNSYTQENDIALLELARELCFSKGVHKIKLSKRHVRSVNAQMLAWNMCYYTNEKPFSRLEVVYMRTISNKKCCDFYPQGSHESKIKLTKRHVCAITKCRTKKKGLCPVDSGSPLVHNKRQIALLGVPADATCPDTPSIFIRVEPYLRWINMHTKAEEEGPKSACASAPTFSTTTCPPFPMTSPRVTCPITTTECTTPRTTTCASPTTTCLTITTTCPSTRRPTSTIKTTRTTTTTTTTIRPTTTKRTTTPKTMRTPKTTTTSKTITPKPRFTTTTIIGNMPAPITTTYIPLSTTTCKPMRTTKYKPAKPGKTTTTEQPCFADECDTYTNTCTCSYACRPLNK